MQIRPVTTIAECRQVAVLEREIWEYPDAEDIVPAPILIVSVKRGGILLGAFDEAGKMHGFVYSLPAVKNGVLTQWSHMLGVVAGARGSGLGMRLKLAQREAALAMGTDLIEWTFDPLQALNAHFNFAKLGVEVQEYEENAYGESSSPLHAGVPTDRFVAEWHIRRPGVERRLAEPGVWIAPEPATERPIVVNPPASTSCWPGPGRPALDADSPRVLVEIPAGFSRMLLEDPALALDWRLHTREVFTSYFARGYRAVDFLLSHDTAGGHYVLARTGVSRDRAPDPLAG